MTKNTRDAQALTARFPTLLFLGLALAVVAVWTVVLQLDLFARHPLLGAWGAAFDILVATPVVYYLLFVRTRRASAATMIPVIIGALIVAERIVPRDHRGLLLVLGVGAELSIAGWLFLRVRREIRDAKRGDRAHPLDIVSKVVARVAPHPLVAEVIVSEISIVWYALLSWKTESKDERRYPWAGAGDWSAVVLGLGLVIVFESSAVHLWLMQSHPVAAWIVTALDLYGILWLVADARALTLSGVEFDDALELRFGFRWRATIDVESIESIENLRDPEKIWDIKMALLDVPNVLVTCSKQVPIRGLYGLRRHARRIALRIEDARFERRARDLGLWKDCESPKMAELEAPPATVARKPSRQLRMSRARWMETRPEYISIEEWEGHRPDWVDP